MGSVLTLQHFVAIICPLWIFYLRLELAYGPADCHVMDAKELTDLVHGVRAGQIGLSHCLVALSIGHAIRGQRFGHRTAVCFGYFT